MMTLSLIPHHDLERYARLRDAAKKEFLLWADCISDLSSFPSFPSVKKSGSLRSLYQKWSARLSCSPASVRRKWDAWRNGTAEFPAGDWRILVDKSLAGRAWQNVDPSECLPDEFLDYWKMLAGQYQRKSRPAYRALLRQLDLWREGKPWTLGDKGPTYWKIPGYDSPPRNKPGHRHPPGWSERNLYRPLREPDTKVELAIARLGTSAALQALPPIPSTRVGVRPFEYVFFDDLWQDRKVLVLGYTMPARLLQLGCLDLASACYLHFGQRPELPSEGRDGPPGRPSDKEGRDGPLGRPSGVRSRLKERDMRWLVATFLEKFGYPTEYDMHLVLEHGTATLREADAQYLHNISGGRIKCCYTTMERGLVYVWDEKAKGNPRGKALIESWHNLFHNEAAILRGQVGQDRDHCPAILEAQEREASALATFTCLLPEASRARLVGPFASLHDAHHQTTEIIRLINARTDHKCEGFDTTFDWKIKGIEMPFQPASKLPEFLEKNPQFQDLGSPRRQEGDSDPFRQHGVECIEYFPRRESPTERLARLSADVPRGTLSPGLLCKFYEDSRDQKALDDYGRFSFERDGRQYSFAPEVGTDRWAVPSDSAAAIKPGTKYMLYFPPVDPDRVHITTLDGAYLATWPRVGRVHRGQPDSAAAFRDKQKALHARAKELARVNAHYIESEQARIRTNYAIAQEHNLIAEQRPREPLSGLESAYAAEAAARAEAQRTKDILDRKSDPSYPSDSAPSSDPYLVSEEELNQL